MSNKAFFLTYPKCFGRFGSGQINCNVKTGYLKKRQLLRLGMLPPFLTIFCQLHINLPQNFGADGHFEGLNWIKIYDINQKNV